MFLVGIAALLVVSEVHFGFSSCKQFQTNEDDKWVRKETERERHRELL